MVSAALMLVARACRHVYLPDGDAPLLQQLIQRAATGSVVGWRALREFCHAVQETAATPHHPFPQNVEEMMRMVSEQLTAVCDSAKDTETLSAALECWATFRGSAAWQKSLTKQALQQLLSMARHETGRLRCAALACLQEIGRHFTQTKVRLVVLLCGVARCMTTDHCLSVE